MLFYVCMCAILIVSVSYFETAVFMYILPESPTVQQFFHRIAVIKAGQINWFGVWLVVLSFNTALTIPAVFYWCLKICSA